MIQLRIRKTFPAGPESAAFTLAMQFQTTGGVSVLFGPSGSGKTLTLDAIAGFSTPGEGRILVDDRILFDSEAGVNLPPRERNCGYVFQNYALFPHMTLRRNLEFAAQRFPRVERHVRINEMLERFRLKDVSGRRPHEVSGGQKQRCSIARALIANPSVLLLDEPARGLDAPLRAELFGVLRQVRAEFGTPILLVTHNLEECFELGEEVLVVREGKVVQTGPPRQVFDRPANLEVARLMGLFNLLPAEIRALDPARNTSRLRLQDVELTGPYFPGRLLGDRVWLCIRPDQLRVAPRDGRPGPNQIPAALQRVVDRPQTVRLEFEGDISVDLPCGEFEKQKHNKEWVVHFPPEVLRLV
jgi:molybdate transport system ATP-binding protein